MRSGGSCWLIVSRIDGNRRVLEIGREVGNRALRGVHWLEVLGNERAIGAGDIFFMPLSMVRSSKILLKCSYQVFFPILDACKSSFSFHDSAKKRSCK